MTRTSNLLLAAASIGAIAWAGSAMAQAARPAAPAARPPSAAAPAAAAPARAPLPQGPAIAGLCVYSNNYTVGVSAVGKFVQQRLQQLAQQAQAELVAENTALQTDAKALEAARPTLTQEVFQQRALTLQQRDTALQRKAEQRDREMQATEQKALGRVVNEANPLVAQVYGQRNCSLLIDGQAVLGANSAMNITPDVVKLLDAKITQFTFDRERLDQQQAAAGAQPRGQ